MAEAQRAFGRLTRPGDEPELLNRFKVRNFDVTLFERQVGEVREPYLEISHPKNGQHFVCTLEKFKAILAKAEEIVQERQRQREQGSEQQTASPPPLKVVRNEERPTELPDSPRRTETKAEVEKRKIQKPYELLDSYKVHRFDVNVFEQITAAGAQPYCEVIQMAQGPRGQEERQKFVCTVENLNRITDQANQAVQERQKERERGKTFHPLITLDELSPDGTRAKGKIAEVHEDIDDARKARDTNRSLALCPESFSERPQIDQPVEVQRDDSKPDIMRLIRRLEWERDRGTSHTWGVWFEKHTTPRFGHLVNCTNGLDYRGEPEERRVSPLGRHEPGQGHNPLYVILEPHPSLTGVYRVVGETRVQKDAIARVHELDDGKKMAEKVNNPQQFRELSVNPELRKDFGLSL